ncbi:MAG: hypothetical protein ACM3Q4_13230 [Acidobacteriota bacterium]
MKPSVRVLLLLLILIVPAAAARAQEANPSQIVLKDSLITVVPYRPLTEIALGIDNAKAELAIAETRRLMAQTLLSYIDNRIELKQKEIDLIDKRIDVADEAKRESEVAALKGEMQIAEKLFDILKSQKKVREAEVDAAQAQFDYAGSQRMALELEQELGKRRAEHVAVASTAGTEESSLNLLMGDLIMKTLEAQMDAAKKEQALSDRKRDLVNERLKLHQLQKDFSTGGR